MHRSMCFRSGKIATLILALLAFIAALTAPACGQQEIDPTWFDPWATPSVKMVPPSPPRVGAQHRAPKVRFVSASKPIGKRRVRHHKTRPRPS